LSLKFTLRNLHRNRQAKMALQMPCRGILVKKTRTSFVQYFICKTNKLTNKQPYPALSPKKSYKK